MNRNPDAGGIPADIGASCSAQDVLGAPHAQSALNPLGASTGAPPCNGVGQPTVGRLAPSPSAPLHAGNFFSALIAWICVRRAGGRLVLRIDDLDRARCKPAFADAIMRDYERMGLFWDNEDVLFERQRDDAYEAAFKCLERAGLVYPCFCTRADLHAASAPHKGEKPVYAGTCRHLSDAERKKRAQKRHPAYRVAVDGADSITFEDRFQGTYAQDLERECGDFIICRSDELFAYQLAVVVDDLHQGVTQVIRGFDLLDSTPQQMYLRRLLAGEDAPTYEYGHVPLLIDATGRRLSKRDHDASLDALLVQCGSVEAFYGLLAGATGLMPTAAPISLEELTAQADLDVLKGVSSIVWDSAD